MMLAAEDVGHGDGLAAKVEPAQSTPVQKIYVSHVFIFVPTHFLSFFIVFNASRLLAIGMNKVVSNRFFSSFFLKAVS